MNPNSESSTPGEITEEKLARLKLVPQDHPAWNDLYNDLVRVHLPRAFGNDLNEKKRRDVATDTIVVLWTKKIQDANGPGYIYTTANNLARHHFRERSKELSRFESLSAAENKPGGNETQSDGAKKLNEMSQEKSDSESGRRNMVDLMKEALATLTEEDREFIVGYAKFCEANPESKNLSRDFGAIRKLTAEDVRSKVHFIRKQLREYLAKQRNDGL